MLSLCVGEQIVVVLPPFFVTPDTIIPVESTLEFRGSWISVHDIGITIKTEPLCKLRLKDFFCVNHPSVLLPIGVMVGVAALCTILAVRFFRWE